MFNKFLSYLKKRVTKDTKSLVEKQDYTFRLISRTDQSAKGTLIGELNVSEVDQLASVSRIFDDVEDRTFSWVRPSTRRGYVDHTRYYPISWETYTFGETGDRIVDSAGTYKDGKPVLNK